MSYQEWSAEPCLDVFSKREELLLVALLHSPHPQDFVNPAGLSATNLEIFVALFYHRSAVSLAQILGRKCVESCAIRTIDEVAEAHEVVGGILN